jgi:hypothetical protein
MNEKNKVNGAFGRVTNYHKIVSINGKILCSAFFYLLLRQFDSWHFRQFMLPGSGLRYVSVFMCGARANPVKEGSLTYSHSL